MKNKTILIVLAICLGQFVSAQNHDEEKEEIKKGVMELFSSSPTKNIQGTKTSFDRAKNDSIVEETRSNDSLNVIKTLKNIENLEDLVDKLQKKKKLTRKDQEELLELFLIMLQGYQNHVILYDMRSQEWAKSTYTLHKALEFLEANKWLS